MEKSGGISLLVRVQFLDCAIVSLLMILVVSISHVLHDLLYSLESGHRRYVDEHRMRLLSSSWLLNMKRLVILK